MKTINEVEVLNCGVTLYDLETRLNDFVKDKDIVSINQFKEGDYYFATIVYRKTII